MEGTRLGPYQVLAELGSGGMGTVYRAEVAEEAPGLETGRTVALKVIHSHLLSQPGFFQRFLREADIGRSVQHENVVKTYVADALLLEGTAQHFLVMEYVEGQTLRDLLGELKRVPEKLCRHIGREAAKGLAAIHEAGVVHRDIKPENVLITEDHVVKVMDLGVARLQDEAIRLSQAGAFVGSLEYAAPEQFQSATGDPDGRADLHALGVLLYELATGQHPYRDDEVSKTVHNILEGSPRKAGEVNPQLSPFFEEVIATLLAKDRGDRFQAASDLVVVLDQGEKSDWWKERVKALRIETNRPLRRIRIPRETALYGRDDDLAKLHALFERAKAGEGQAVLIEGEAGIGKTRLVDEFVQRLREEGEDFDFLFGSYPPGGAATAAGAFSTAYREHLGAVALEEALPKYMPDCLPLIPAFSAVLRGTPIPAGAPSLDRDSLTAVFVHVTRALARERPIVILIDDLHFAPEEGRAITAALAAAIPEDRVMLLAAARPELPEDWEAEIVRLGHVTRLALRRLGPKDLVSLLKDTLQSRRSAEELSLIIAEKSDGNPFFVFEILGSLREDGRLVLEADGTWRATQVIKDVEIPSSVLDLVRSRIAGLEEPDRHLLDVAACCGYEFDPEVAAVASDMEVVVALRRLGVLEHKHHLIRSVGRRCAFDHHQVQEALYQGILEPLRRRLHRRIAEAIEHRGVDKEKPLRGAEAVDLVLHYFEADEGGRARAYLDAALEHLEDGYLHDAAASVADRALRWPGLFVGAERVGLLLRMARRLGLLGRRREERAALDEALALSEDVGDARLRAKALMALGRHGIEVTQADQALAAYQEAMEISNMLGEASLEMAALGGLGTSCARLGRFDDAKGHHQRQLEIARSIGDRGGEAMASGSLGNVAWYLGRYDEAYEYFQRDAEITGSLGDPAGEAACMANLGVLQRVLGRPADARTSQMRALTLFRNVGDRRGEAICLSNLGNTQHDCGEFAEAMHHFEDAIRICQDIRDLNTEANARQGLARILMEVGDFDHAEHEVDVLERLGPRAKAPRITKAAARERAILLAYLGRVDEAIARTSQCLASLEKTEDHREEAKLLLSLGLLYSEAGRQAEANAELERACALGRAHDIPDALLLASAQRAVLGLVPADAVLQLLEQRGDAGTYYPRMHVHFMLWQATGDPVHLAQAKQLFDNLVEHAPEEVRTPMQTEVPLHRNIVAAWAEHGEKGEGQASDS